MKERIVSELKKKDGEVRLVCATEALSMGVDVPDIREIHHVGPPNSPESKFLSFPHLLKKYIPLLAKKNNIRYIHLHEHFLNMYCFLARLKQKNVYD